MLTDVRVYRVKIALFEFFCQLQIYKSDFFINQIIPSGNWNTNVLSH